MTNADHAAALLDEADAALSRRKILLVTRVALTETTSLPAARKVLRQWDTGPAEVRAAALALLDTLTERHATP